MLTVGEADLLPRLFNEVVIPEAVRDELLHSHPLLPPWLHTRAVRNQAEISRLASWVDAGEAEAIELAREIQADRLLIDERKGRRLALAEGVPVIGLVGAVLLAKRRQFIPSARTLLHRLEEEAGIYFLRPLGKMPSSLSASRQAAFHPWQAQS